MLIVFIVHILCAYLFRSRCREDEEFTINACGAGGQGKVDVKITSPSRRPIPCKVEAGASNEVHIAKYIPRKRGHTKWTSAMMETPYLEVLSRWRE